MMALFTLPVITNAHVPAAVAVILLPVIMT